MKTNYLVGAALVAMLNCAIANADLLGASTGLGGSLGGNLSGTRDIGLTGSGNGSFGADFDSRPLRRTTSEAADRAKSTAAATKSAAAEKVQDVKSSKVDASADSSAAVGLKK